jgi:hypothetical protein
MAGGQFGGGYAMLDINTGRRIARHENISGYRVGAWDMQGKPDAYIAAVIGGDYVFLSMRGDRDRKHPWNSVTVVQAGPHGRYIAHNRMKLMQGAHPSFDGERVYYRDEQSLICIGYKGEQGRIYEAEQNAKWLFEDLDHVAPAEATPLTPEPDPKITRSTIPYRHDRSRIAVLTSSIGGWVALGPFPADSAEQALAALGGPEKARLSSGRSVTVNGTTVKARSFDKAAGAKIMSRTSVRTQTFDLLALADGKPKTVVYTYGVLAWPDTRTVRLVSSLSNVDLWIGGVKIRPRDRVTLKPGKYPILARLRAGDAKSNNALHMYLSDSDDYAVELKRWKAGVKLSKPILDRIIKYKPDSDLAAKARQCLAAL